MEYTKILSYKLFYTQDSLTEFVNDNNIKDIASITHDYPSQNFTLFYWITIPKLINSSIFSNVA